MRHILIIFSSLFLCFQGFSQKDISKVIDAENIRKIIINGDEIFRINLVAAGEKKQVKITAHSEGEYYNNIALDHEMEQEKLIISSNFAEILQGGYDKLSAHKVFSLEVDIEIPEGLEVYVESNIAALTARGKFKNLQVQLKSGFCKIIDFEGNALVNTYSGFIEVETHNAVIDAVSRGGKVSLQSATGGKFNIKLHSGTGDIRVREN